MLSALANLPANGCGADRPAVAWLSKGLEADTGLFIHQIVAFQLENIRVKRRFQNLPFVPKIFTQFFTGTDAGEFNFDVFPRFQPGKANQIFGKLVTKILREYRTAVFIGTITKINTFWIFAVINTV